MRSHPSFLLAFCLLAPAGVAWSQPSPSPAVEELRPLDMRTTDMVPVDAFVGDSTVLSTSLFGIQYGLQQSAQFEQLMQSQIHGGQYVRRAGGLYAMFPASTYQPTASGYVPTIPPGTVFHIGGLPPTQAQGPSVQDPSRMSSDRHSHRNDYRDLEGVASSPIVNVPVVPDAEEESVEIRFIADEAYRRRTIQSLVWRSIDRSKPTVDQAARGSSSSESK
ncbi:MAG: hypothetical protein P8L37_03025 [Phycisphaerales bacterium]|nr:hypothetical protein [Phycisphaerales bacterium]